MTEQNINEELLTKGIIGLKNRGNTCYMNTAIQCLSNIHLLTSYFLQNEYIADLSNRFQEVKNKKLNEIILSREYGKLIKSLWGSNSSIDPKSFHECIENIDEQFEGYEQQDTQEILALILDNLHEGLKYDVNISHSGVIENDIDEIMIESISNWKTELKEKYSIIVELFFGQFINKIISLEKNDNRKILSKKFEVFNMLSIPIHGKTLYTSLAKYFEKEVLETQFYDEKRNLNVKAYKEIKLMKVPKYFIIVLKRYKNKSNGHSVKSNNVITFPIDNLDLTPFAEGYDTFSCNMKLISIGCHEGFLNGGHYYAVCRHINNNWYKYNDDTVSVFNIKENILSLFQSGYVLIYERIN